MDQAETVCRLCLQPNRGANSSIRESEIRSQLAVVFKFELADDDSLPDSLCEECTTKVAEFHDFHESVRINQCQLMAASLVEDSIEDNVPILEEIKAEPVDEDSMDTVPTLEIVKEEPMLNMEDDYDLHQENMSNDMAEEKSERRVINADNRKSSTGNGVKRKTYKCTQCATKFPSKLLLNAHTITHAKVHCSICDEPMATTIDLKLHMDHKHPDVTRNVFICNICGVVLANKKTLDQHIKRHQGPAKPKQVQCPHCRKTIYCKYYLREHIEMFHSDRDVRQTCDACKKVFSHQRALRRHKCIVTMNLRSNHRKPKVQIHVVAREIL